MKVARGWGALGRKKSLFAAIILLICHRCSGLGKRKLGPIARLTGLTLPCMVGHTPHIPLKIMQHLDVYQDMNPSFVLPYFPWNTPSVQGWGWTGDLIFLALLPFPRQWL